MNFEQKKVDTKLWRFLVICLLFFDTLNFGNVVICHKKMLKKPKTWRKKNTEKKVVEEIFQWTHLQLWCKMCWKRKKNTQFACNCRDLTTVYKFIKNCLYSRIIPSPVNCFVANLLVDIVAVLLLAGIVFWSVAIRVCSVCILLMTVNMPQSILNVIKNFWTLIAHQFAGDVHKCT